MTALLDSQAKQILEALRNEPKGLTGADMFYRFGALSYTRRIRDIREAGVPVCDTWEEKLDERGKVIKKWKRYFLPEDVK